MSETTPKEYLKSIGIDLNTTSLFTVIDGYARQPDLCSIMDSYAKLKVEEQKHKEKYPKDYQSIHTESNH